MSENQRKLLPSECVAPDTVPCGKSGPNNCITFTKRLEGLRLQILGQKSLILPWYTFKLVGKIALRRGRAKWSSILLLNELLLHASREKC